MEMSRIKLLLSKKRLKLANDRADSTFHALTYDKNYYSLEIFVLGFSFHNFVPKNWEKLYFQKRLISDFNETLSKSYLS